MQDSSILLDRDDDYNLRTIVRGRHDGTKKVSLNGRFPGSRAIPFGIMGIEKASGLEYALNNCFIQSSNITNKPQSKQNYENYEGALIVGNTRIKYRDEEITGLTEWYLNGPSWSLIFPRATYYDYGKNIKIRRDPKGIVEPSPEVIASRASADHFHIDLGLYSFNIVKVHERFKPTWSKKNGIEYLTELGNIPDEKERNTIGEFISFLFGGQLFHVGRTSFNGTNVVETVSHSPWGNNVKHVCKQGSRSPITTKDGRFEPLAEELLPVS